MSSSAKKCSDKAAIPSEFICPITMELMIHPVMTRYGHCFDRSAIVTWICSNDRLEGECPLTRKRLRISDIINHYSLAERIRLWCMENNYPLKRNTNSEGEDSTYASSDEDDEVNHFFVSTDLRKPKKCKSHKDGTNATSSERRHFELTRSTSLSAIHTNLTNSTPQRTKVSFVKKAFSWSHRS
jgi:hypothetical protein